SAPLASGDRVSALALVVLLPQAPGGRIRALGFLASLRARCRACRRADECLHQLVGFVSRFFKHWGLKDAALQRSDEDIHRIAGKRDRAPELMRGKPRARMRPPGA
ncbi:MAG: hypothetical protein V3S45_05580, partial [Kiloniellales bacterium]